MDFNALYTRAAVMDMGHCEHTVRALPRFPCSARKRKRRELAWEDGSAYGNRNSLFLAVPGGPSVPLRSHFMPLIVC